MNCYDSQHVSRRMRRALQGFQESAAAGVGDGAGAGRQVEALGERVTELEEENRELRELVEAQANRLEELEEENRGLRKLVETQAHQIEELERQVVALEQEQQPKGDAERADAGKDQRQRRPRQLRHLPYDTGVVTLEKQPDEENTLGPAVASVVAEWRVLRNPAARRGSRVDRAKAAVRRWELEVELLRDFRLTLPPETEPLDDSRRADHIRWRLEAMADAKRELARAKWIRVLTLGLWRR